MDPHEHQDVIVIGSGPAGGTMAAELAATGKKILLLERGDWLPRERANWESEEVFGNSRYGAAETFYDRDDKPFHPGMHYFVGGNSKVYGAALFRLTPADFGQITQHGGISPAWPISYDDLEPYYVRAEHMYKVHGKHGEDPFAGKSSEDYKYPPVQHAPRIQQLSDGLTGLGLHPFHLPIGVDMIQDEQGQATHDSPCIRCDRVDGFPCLVGAKSDSETIAVRPALAAHSNLQLLTRATVRKLLTDDAGGSVTGVVTEMPDGSTQTFTADIVVLSAGSILSSALLLASANDKHPHGLANSSDVVGRHYMRHNNVALMALSKDPNPTTFQKTLAINDFYGPSKFWDYPMGNIQMLGKSDDWQVKGEAPKMLQWGPDFGYRIAASHSMDFWLAGEDLPLPTSRVTLRNDGSIKLALTPDNNTEGVKRLRACFDDMLTDLGMASKSFARGLYLHKRMDVSATAHQAGTVRFGTDPTTSALDLDCKAHELDNLYVVDGSFMPSIGAVNPTLTIIANAIRVAERIAARLR
ncbi:GMC oxidoreductase [Nocardioides panaciterrulae]|uniref:Choline dehydrogenase-like flavoprotein n=1 Tax=Nocardioides panaciterrulae TaxID=661492 RepID=A0A7Y9J984_9ACTN|nr:GMC family oxidoreductase [Nocardioides panaciterrulae]NYD40058.1 choline dehydrogenase-like flavoprotein [Nocardioides panaciterrulae]